MIRLAAAVLVVLLAVACGGEDPKPDPAPVPVAPAPAPDPAPDPEPAPEPDLADEGYEHLRHGRREEARASFEALLERDPDSADAHRALAALDLHAGRPDDAVKHVAAVLDLEASADERFEKTSDGYQYVLFLLDRYFGGEGDLRLVEEAHAVCPHEPRSSMILSDVRWGSGEPGKAMALLEGAAPTTKEMSSCDGDVLFRLAVRRLQSGDAEGYAKAVARIPADFPVRRLADALGEPKEAGAVVVPGRPSSLPGSVEVAFEDLVFTTDELDPEVVIRSGHVVVLDRLVAGDPVPLLSPIVLWGYLPGLDAFLTDDPSPAVPPVMSAAEVRTGLLRVLRPGAARSATGRARGTAIDRALADLDAGRLKEAWDGLAGHMDHPLARFVRARIALSKGLGAEAVLLVTGEARKPLPGAGWALLYGEALLARGEVGRALQVLKRSEREDGLKPGHPLTRRVGALTLMKTDDDSETIAALAKLVADRPRYAGAWEDLAGLHLAAGRFVEGRDVLVSLVREIPEFAELPRYLMARRRAAAGLIDGARTAKTLMLLDETDEAGLRRLAVMSTERLPVAEKRKALAHFVGDPDVNTRILALRAIAQDGWKGSEDAVRPCLKDPDPKVRGAAVRTLRLIGDRTVLGTLLPFLSDDALYVREVAINEIRDMTGKEFGYEADAPEPEREAAIGRWMSWAKSDK